jgi:tetratricopeptide (TPR) repeat protein
MTPDPSDKCLAAIYQGGAEMERGSFGAADFLFRIADKLARSLPPDPARDFAPLVLCHISLLRTRQGKADEGKKLQELAAALLDENANRMEAVKFQDLMANVLIKLHEYRRAIPFCERGLQRELESNDPVAIAGKLARLGQCYGSHGLKDHSAVPLRAALKIFRDYPGDPRLPGVLIALGNALRKSSPAEAESLYKEAVELHLARTHLESATVAWVNLGVLCGEQGRNAESLEHYEKALHIREQFPATPLASMGRLLNNIANSHRRMGNFEKAHKLLDRAIELLMLDKQDGPSVLPSAYGTRGLIFRDAGNDAEAVEWLQRSYAERKNTPSPNFEPMVEDLEAEIAALKRLGRTEEAVLAEERLASVSAAIHEIPGFDRDLSSLVSQARGSVQIELCFGSRPGNRYNSQDSTQLIFKLMEALEGRGVGFCGGRVTIPESTTLMFYGEDAELLFHALEPILLSEPMCKQASLEIRQGKEARVMILPGDVM